MYIESSIKSISALPRCLMAIAMIAVCCGLPFAVDAAGSPEKYQIDNILIKDIYSTDNKYDTAFSDHLNKYAILVISDYFDADGANQGEARDGMVPSVRLIKLPGWDSDWLMTVVRVLSSDPAEGKKNVTIRLMVQSNRTPLFVVRGVDVYDVTFSVNVSYPVSDNLNQLDTQ